MNIDLKIETNIDKKEYFGQVLTQSAFPSSCPLTTHFSCSLDILEETNQIHFNISGSLTIKFSIHAMFKRERMKSIDATTFDIDSKTEIGVAKFDETFKVGEKVVFTATFQGKLNEAFEGVSAVP